MLKAYLSWLDDGVLVEVVGIAGSLVRTMALSSLEALWMQMTNFLALSAYTHTCARPTHRPYTYATSWIIRDFDLWDAC